ncbi:serine hydrolase domain-containing protein [Glycomyces arizonensis]|uniref:serine hydrolase domain-containing protein n=1 Tax=Glycomyces arizonensis TaxID=256035 RepID=UPI000A037B4D|nr:serine hydrolase domain-containing protein [Glycomyces arizonensis]
MRRIIPILAAMALAACTADAADPGDTGTEEPPGCDAALVRDLSSWAEAGFSGSIAFASDAGLGCTAAFGLADAESGTPNTAETVFAIGSVSKAFTAAAIFDLIDAGELALDDRAGDLVAGLAGPAADATVEQLLLHTSGLTGTHGDDHVPLGREEAVAALSELDTAFEPGTDFGYSNSGYTLLALIIDEVSGESYRDYMADAILRLPGRDEAAGGFWDGEPAPAGPKAIGYVDGERAESLGDFAGPHWAMSGNGDLAMTAADLASWTEAMFDGEVIAPEAVEQLTGTVFEHGDGSVEAPGWVAFDASVYGTPVYTVAGGGGDTGHNAVVAWLPETHTALAITSNTSAVIASELLDAIGPALAAGEPIPVPDEGVEADPAELAAAEGTYSLESGSVFTVEAEDGRLAVAADGADAVAALSVPTGGFTAEDFERHEQAVLALLGGETEAGRAELETLEADIGDVRDVAAVGTVVEDGELRTYVSITADETTLAWYALDEHGAVAAVLLDPGPPVFTLVPVGDGEYRQERLDGAGLGVRAVFDGDLMTVTGPEGTVEAHRNS